MLVNIFLSAARSTMSIGNRSRGTITLLEIHGICDSVSFRDLDVDLKVESTRHGLRSLFR